MYTTIEPDSAASAPYFAPAEFERRLQTLHRAMAQRSLELLLISAPENIFYLTGLDHWGYFAPHILAVPLEGEMVLLTRAMEKVTVANQVRNARFEGHSDKETVADAFSRTLGAMGRPARIGIETWSSGLPHGLALALQHQAPAAEWLDASGIVDDLRLVKSPAEQGYLRAAARISDIGAAAAIEATSAGASEQHIAAECERAMLEAGGTFPGFGPFIRSRARLGEEHTSWTATRLAGEDALFLELTGCVARYHAPLGRLIHVGRAPKRSEERRVGKECRSRWSPYH